MRTLADKVKEVEANFDKGQQIFRRKSVEVLLARIKSLEIAAQPTPVNMAELAFGKPCADPFHTWLWLGKNVLDDSPPPDDYRCKCGALTWAQRDDSKT